MVGNSGLLECLPSANIINSDVSVKVFGWRTGLGVEAAKRSKQEEAARQVLQFQCLTKDELIHYSRCVDIDNAS